ncbi:MAG: nitronate monooxygenase [Chloroflexota bacterium]|nr:nitronate monooxygenase [Chloroflexota bacterium]
MLRSRLTERFKLDHPVMSAPMGFAGGGKLAAAVSAAGGLGLIGGGYGEERWLREQIKAAGNQRVGCGFITWSLKKQPHLLEIALDGAPGAMFLSFGDPKPFVGRIRQAGVPFMCQIQTVLDARRAIDLGADVLVAQGAEAGGHGEKRGTFTLVPEVADLISSRASETLLCAAGGVADGRGLAAALALGADGVVVGTRFWASEEALVHPNLQAAAVSASGDDTLRSRVIDMVRGLDYWPARYDLRTLRRAATDRWHGKEAELRAVAEAEVARYAEAAANGDAGNVSAIAGEAVGLIHGIAPAGTILRTMTTEAEDILRKAAGWIAA